MYLIYYILLFLNLALLYCFLRLELKRFSPVAVFWFVVISAFLLPALFDPFVGYVKAHPYSVSYELDILTLVESQAFILLFAFCIAGVYFCLFRAEQINSFSNELGGTQKFLSSQGLYWIFGFLLLSFYSFFEAYRKFGSLVFSEFGFVDRREGLSFVAGFLLSYNLIICAGSLFWMVLVKRYALACVVFFIYMFVYFVMGGSRQPIIILLLPFLFYFLSNARHGFYFAVIATFSFGVFSKILEFFIYLRNLPGLEARLDAVYRFYDFIFFYSERLGSNESDLRFAFYYFVKEFNNISGFGDGVYFMRTLFFWLPSFLDFFHLKPPDFEYVMFSAFMPGFEGTMHPTFFGSLYADYGWFVVPWILGFSLLLIFTNPILRLYKGVGYFAVWGGFAYLYMMMARGAIYGPFVVLFFGLLFVGLSQTTFSLFFKRVKG